MTRIVGSKDCGNSPKNRFAQDVMVALLTGETAFLEAALDDDAVWVQPDGVPVTGKSAIIAISGRTPLETVTVLHALSHGRAGAANATVQPVSEPAYGFCCVLDFANTKGDRVARITSYRTES